MNLVSQYITEIIGAVATITAYFVGVKKDKADAFITMQKSYKTFADDMSFKYEVMRESIEVMRKDNQRLEERLAVFEENENKLRQLIQTLETKIIKLEQENRKLRTRLNKYEKE